ncbi:MAG: glycosyltransferase family 4 protein [Ferruginibacter sp.]|nr:glycosyltransferase family 4 protein [Ferruginibacter sp.]
MVVKILFLSHKFFPDIGGIEVNSSILANAFHEAGHEIRLMTWSNYDKKNDFPFEVIRKPNFIRLFREHLWADIIFENNPCLRLSWPLYFFKKKSVIAVRAFINRRDGKIGWQDKIKLWWLSRASAVIAVSNPIKNKCFSDSIVIGNPYRNNLFRVLPNIDKKKSFVFLGRLVSDKGADLAISAFSSLIHSGDFQDSMKLTIIGDGPELDKLKAMATSLHVDRYVDFVGMLEGEELVLCLNKHRFMIVPSVGEAFGNVVLEGMACGCVPIVSDGSGLVDAVGDAGLCFKQKDLDSLINNLIKLVENPELENYFRSKATVHLSSHRPEIVCKKYLTVIESIL